MFNDISEQYLDKLYDDMKKEQDRLMNDIKTGSEATKETENQKQINGLNKQKNKVSQKTSFNLRPEK